MKQKTGRKLLSFLLTLAMLVGLMPGMSLTAYAATSHGITINAAQHGTVTASVNGSAATSAEEGATVTLTANPENGYRLKSISGTYKGNLQEKKGLNSTKTINGTYFNLSATDTAYAGWNLKNNNTITITSKDSSVKIDKVDFNIQFKGNSFNLNNVSCSAGTKSLNGNTLSVSSINGTTVTLSSGANNAGAVRFNSVTIYGTGAVDTNLTISTTGDVNVRTFTMPAVVQGDVTITPVFEEIPKYNVTLNGGANATTSGGNTTQTGVTGAMTTVTYTANSGYHFTEFANITNNGITATRTSDTVVTVSGTPTADASITIPDAVKLFQTITASDVTATYGDTDKSVIASVTNPAEGGGAISYAVKDGSADYIDVNATTGALTIKKVPASGKAYVIVKAAATDDYAETTKEVTVTISKAEATVAAKDQNIMVGGTVPDLSAPVLNTHYTITGLVGTDALTTAPTLTYQKNGSAATPDSATAGTYDIVPSGASAGDNYNISYTKGTLTITAKDAQTITAEDVTATYGDTNAKIEATTTSGGGTLSYAIKSGDAVTVDENTGALTIVKAGSAVITVTAAETATYAQATKDVNVTVNTKAMTVSAENVNVTVDGQPHGITVNVTDPASGATVKYGTEVGTYNLDASPTQTEAGELTVYYQVTADNYTTYTGNAKVTVNAKQTQTITASNVTATYGDTNKKVEATTNGNGAISYAVKEGSADYIDVDSTTGALTIKKVGTATVIVTAAETAAYAQATKEVTVTIGKANAVAATVTANNRTYDGTEKPLVTVTGEATGGEMQYALGTATEATQPYTTSIPAKTNAGTYYVWYKAVGDENHIDSEAKCIEATIALDDSKTVAPKEQTLTSNGTPQPLVKPGSIEGDTGTLFYALGSDAVTAPTDGWSTEVPTATNAGTYYVWYKVEGDANHNNVDPACIVVTIAEAAKPEQPAAAPAAAPAASTSDYTLLASLKTSGKKALKISWTAVPDAQGYDIFFGQCNTGECHYLDSTNAQSYKIKGLKKGNAYKAFVRAWKMAGSEKVYIGEASPDVHAIAGGRSNKYTNPKKISVKKKKLTVGVGKTKAIKAKLKKFSDSREYLNHVAKVRYFSSDRNVATVSANGRVTGVGVGKCTVYAVAENGLRVGVTVTVK